MVNASAPSLPNNYESTTLVLHRAVLVSPRRFKLQETRSEPVATYNFGDKSWLRRGQVGTRFVAPRNGTRSIGGDEPQIAIGHKLDTQCHGDWSNAWSSVAGAPLDIRVSLFPEFPRESNRSHPDPSCFRARDVRWVSRPPSPQDIGGRDARAPGAGERAVGRIDPSLSQRGEVSGTGGTLACLGRGK